MAERSFGGPDDEVLNLDRRWVHGALVVRVTGELDMTTSPRLRQALGEALDEAAGAVVIVDVTSVTFLGSPGLAALFEAAINAKQRGGPLRIVADPTRPAVRPLQVSGLNNVLTFYETIDDALAD